MGASDRLNKLIRMCDCWELPEKYFTYYTLLLFTLLKLLSIVE